MIMNEGCETRGDFNKYFRLISKWINDNYKKTRPIYVILSCHQV